MERTEIVALKDKGILVTTGYGEGIGGWALAGFRKSPVVSLDHASAMPTDAECQLLRGYAEYVARLIYHPHFIQEILEQGVEGHNTTLFLKGPDWHPNGECGWAYRKMTWTQGPTFIPCMDSRPAPPWSLLRLLDHVEMMGGRRNERWERWKAEHPELVEAVPAGQ